MNVKSVIKNVNRKSLMTNAQRVAYTLLNANGQWVPRTQLTRVAKSATARVRDLRKAEFGKFTVDCQPASALNRKGDSHTFFYRIRPTTVKKTQISTVFGL